MIWTMTRQPLAHIELFSVLSMFISAYFPISRILFHSYVAFLLFLKNKMRNGRKGSMSMMLHILILTHYLAVY